VVRVVFGGGFKGKKKVVPKKKVGGGPSKINYFSRCLVSKLSFDLAFSREILINLPLFFCFGQLFKIFGRKTTKLFKKLGRWGGGRQTPC